MNGKIRKSMLRTLFLFCLLLLGFPLVMNVSAFPIYSGVEFHTTSGTVTFSSTLYTTNVKADNTNDRWVFKNVYMGSGDVVSEWWVKVQNAEVTFTKFFSDDKLRFAVSGSGTGTVSLSVPQKPHYVTVDGVKYTSWTYAEGSKTLTITLALSNHDVIVYFSPVAEAFSTFRTLWGSLIVIIAIVFSFSLVIKVANGDLTVMEFIWGFIGVIVGTGVLFILLQVIEAL